MRAKFLRDDIEYAGPPHMYKDATTFVEVLRNRVKVQRRFWKVGAVVTDPKAFRLVQMGVAEPADEECEQMANMTPANMDAARYSYERLRRGIHTDDFDRYDRGEITGYNPDGTDIPGPNWTSTEDIEEQEEEDEDYE